MRLSIFIFSFSRERAVRDPTARVEAFCTIYSFSAPETQKGPTSFSFTFLFSPPLVVDKSSTLSLFFSSFSASILALFLSTMSHAAIMSSSVSSARASAATVAKAPSASAARPQSATPPPQRRPALIPSPMRRPSLSSSPSSVASRRRPAPPAAAAGGSGDSDPYKVRGIGSSRALEV